MFEEKKSNEKKLRTRAIILCFIEIRMKLISDFLNPQSPKSVSKLFCDLIKLLQMVGVQK